MSEKAKLATIWLDGCSGCHMSFLDIDERLIDLAAKVDVVYSPLVDPKECPEMADITLVEGAVSSQEDLEKIKNVRAHTRILVAYGDCAVTSNVSGMRNQFKVEDVYSRAYLENADENQHIPVQVIPPLLPKSLPVHHVVDVDVYLPGCPPPADAIFYVLMELLEGRCRGRPALVNKEAKMGKIITIDPVTRIEGHSKITLQLDDKGEVADARFHVTQFRGFEKMTEGRPFYKMPSLTARICGICPVSHLITSAKACDELMAVQIPEAAVKLRKIINLAQIIQSHALSFFHLSSPDIVLGFDAPPAKRNIFGVLEKYPELGRDGIMLRKFGQEIIELLGGKRIHPAWVVPGGVNEPLTESERQPILAALPEAKERILRTLRWYKGVFGSFDPEIRSFANFPTLFMGMVKADGRISFYQGKLRIVDAMGKIVADQLEPADYQRFLAEYVEPDSYLKSPYYRPMGYPDGIFRVGPLARMNIIDRMGTPLADQEWAEFRMLQRGAVLSSFQYHYARLIEILYGIERIEQLLHAPDILSTHVRAHAQPNRFEGVGMAETPRGTLLHHYKIDERGLMTWSNLIIATGNNNLAMNRGVLQVARHFIKGNGKKLTEPMLNRVEGVIRTFDPCLSCSTHAAGAIPLHIQLFAPDGELLDEAKCN